MRRSGPARAIRGVAAGLLTTFLAFTFHVLGGGQAPPALALLTCAAATTWAAVIIGRSRPSLPLLVAAVAVGQVILHTAFSITTAGQALTGVTGAAHDHAGQGAGLLLASVGHTGGSMWLVHVLAGLVTIVVIRHGERALRGVARVARTAIVGLVGALRVAEPAATPTELACSTPRAVSSELARISAGLGSALVRRGPPTFAR